MIVSVVTGICFICGVAKRLIFSAFLLSCLNVWYRSGLYFDREGFC